MLCRNEGSLIHTASEVIVLHELIKEVAALHHDMCIGLTYLLLIVGITSIHFIWKGAGK